MQDGALAVGARGPDAVDPAVVGRTRHVVVEPAALHLIEARDRVQRVFVEDAMVRAKVLKSHCD